MAKTFNELASSGEELGFYGMDGNFFKLGRDVFEAVEDESDGYRSYLGEIRSLENPPAGKLVFFQHRRVDTVKVRNADDTDFEGYEIVSVKDGHVWVRIGTDNTDNYYPSCHIEYTPRAVEAR